MFLIKGIGELLTFEGVLMKKGKFLKEEDLSLKTDQCLLLNKGKIEWIGALEKLPEEYSPLIAKELDVQGRTVLPGFVECHTHSIFSGHRAQEFEWRLEGVSYGEITARGGGIHSTLEKTRESSFEDLRLLGQKRVNSFLSQGVTTLEIKSGYGLDALTEIKMLEVMKMLRGPQVIRTFLGAHAVPKEFLDEGDYLNFIEERVFPDLVARGLCDRVDIFIEKGFFSKERGEVYLRRAQERGLDVVIHANQLSASGGAELAVKLGARSADHLIEISDSEIEALAQSSVVGVLLPLADLYMGLSYPPARKLLDAGVTLALATDFNPGTAPSQDLSLVGLLARLEMRMSLVEVLGAYTVGAAKALGLEKTKGALVQGMDADFLCIDGDWTELFYSTGSSKVQFSYMKGELVYSK